MTPQELLKETQRAIGGDEMVAEHQKMVDLWNEHKTISAVCNPSLVISLATFFSKSLTAFRGILVTSRGPGFH